MNIADQIKGHSCGLEEYQPGETRYWSIKGLREQFKRPLRTSSKLSDLPNYCVVYDSSETASEVQRNYAAPPGATELVSDNKASVDVRATKLGYKTICVLQYNRERDLFDLIDWWTVKP